MRWTRALNPPPLPLLIMLPRHWEFECTFAWPERNRWLDKDDEGLPATEAAWIYAPSPNSWCVGSRHNRSSATL
jgi:hypothetical protein